MRAGPRAPAGTGGAISRPERLLPAWPAAAHLLCYTHGEASNLNETGASLRRARAGELRQASSALGAATIILLGYPDGGLACTAEGELAAHVTRLAARHRPGGLLVFDDTGITGHPHH